VSAVARPVVGRERVVRTLQAALRSMSRVAFERRVVNGAPGLVMAYDGGTAVLAFVVGDGQISRVDVVANPDKLRRVPPPEP
jgi:hypothetical protein